jgi:pimeloyl-ACP methyl ester carboxylesterase
MIGSSLDVDQGAEAKLLQPILALTGEPDPDFKIPPQLLTALHGAALGNSASPGARETWTTLVNETYSGESGRLKLRQATMMVLSRDSLNIRAPDLKMPILWIQGSEDVILSPENGRRELALTGSVDPRFEVVQGGHYSSHTTHPEIVNALLKEFVEKHGE